MFYWFLNFSTRNMTKRLVFSSNDFNLFDGELNSYEYEYFSKHIGAFKRFMQEEPVEQRQEFLDAFCEYCYNHIELRAAIGTMSDPKKKFIESFQQYAQEAFVNAKFSAAKQFLNDSVIVARNRHMISYMDSHSYAKDPFFHKETRDVFRRLFGEPTEAGTCVKVICILPLYVRFAGSICRYLKKWLDMEELLYPMPVKPSKKNRDKKAMKEQAITSRNMRTASSHQTKSAVNSSKTLSTAQKSSSTVGNLKAVPAGQQSTALAAKTNGDSAEKAEDDLSSFYYDMHERKQRKREERKKGKRYEIACQHPCHGKGKGCCSQTGGHDHHHHHHHDAPSPSPEQMMACLCEKHRALAEAKIAERKAALEKQQQNEKCGAKKVADVKSASKSSGDYISEGKSSENKNSDIRSSEDKSSEEKDSEGKSPEDKSAGDKSSGVKNPEDKNSEERNTKDEKNDSKSSEVNDFQEESFEFTHNAKDSEVKTIENNDYEEQTAESKDSERQTSGSNISEEQTSDKEDFLEQTTYNKDSEGLTSEIKDSVGKTVEVKSSEGQTSEDKDEEQIEGSKKSEENEVKTSEVKSPTGKKKHSHKRISENGVVSSDSDCEAAVERFVNRAFPELHLCKPHPNQQYEDMMAKEGAKKLKESKFRTCAFCRKQETEMKTFKKCQKCKGKGTKFYCSRDCQKLDWTKHRLEH